MGLRVFVCLIMSFLGSLLHAQMDGYTVVYSGRVFNAESQLYEANKDVYFKVDLNEPGAQHTVTNDSGYFEFRVSYFNYTGSMVTGNILVESCSGTWNEVSLQPNILIDNTIDGIAVTICEENEPTIPGTFSLSPSLEYGEGYYLVTFSNEAQYPQWDALVNESSSVGLSGAFGNSINLFKGLNRFQTIEFINDTTVNFATQYVLTGTTKEALACYPTTTYLIDMYFGNQVSCLYASNVADLSIQWDFDGEGTSTLQNPTFTFQSGGAKTICFNSSIEGTCNLDSCLEISLSEGSECSAEFDVLDNGYNNFGFDFSANSPQLFNEFENFIDVKWEIDGQEIESSVYFMGFNVHYPQVGTHEVCSYIRIGECRDTACHTFLVPMPNPIPSDCTPYFTWSDLISNGFNRIKFQAETTAETYSWNFGDGSTSNLPLPIHTYSSAGTYEVCLTTTLNGCTAEYCDSITVEYSSNCADTIRVFKFSGNRVKVAYPISCIYFNCLEPYSWDFGDGNFGSFVVGNHSYESGGTKNICFSMNYMGICDTLTCKLVDLDIGNNRYQGQLQGYPEGADYSTGSVILYELVFDLAYYNIQLDTLPTSYLHAIDTIQPNSDGSFEFNSIYNGYYTACYIPAENFQSEGYIRSYNSDRFIWSQAKFEFITPPTSYYLHPLTILQISDTVGPGAVYGSIQFGPFRLSEDLDFLNDARLYVTQGNSVIKKLDLNGTANFEFSNLAFGQYTLKLDMPNTLSKSVDFYISPDNLTDTLIIPYLIMDEISFTTDIALQESQEEFLIYPNPGNGIIELKIPNSFVGDNVIQIYSLTGSTLYEQHNLGQKSEIQIHPGYLPAGIYFLRYSTQKGKTQTFKLVRN